MDIIKVLNKSQIEEFHNVVHTIYKDEKNWIPHIKQDVETVFNPKRNSYHKRGEIERFILKKDNLTIGRIAVFYTIKEKPDSMKTGGVGFFECVNKMFRYAIFIIVDNFYFQKSRNTKPCWGNPIL